MKIFVIGFNKTGTLSIHNLFKKININSVHTSQQVLEIIDKYDAFTDGHHRNFEKYYEKYPDSLFILNTRPIFKWLVSRYKHASFHNFNICWCWPISDEKTNHWISVREKHYKKIFNFFSDKPEQLLIVNIEKKGYESNIIKFIKFKENNNIISKVNVRSDNQIKQIEDIKKNVSKCLEKLGYNGSECLLKDNICSNIYTTFL